jgi:putative hydrolase
MSSHHPNPNSSNNAIACQLDEAATILESQDAGPHRVRAYRRAAATLRDLDQSVDDILLQQGQQGLEALPGVGTTIARGIADIIASGTWPWLEHLKGQYDPEAAFQTVPGIGPGLAARIHHDLGIADLEELELAAHDGRLATLEGFGTRRVRAVRESLAGRFGRYRRPQGVSEPPVAELLDIDREYRSRAEQDELPRLTPHRFNPEHLAWLPVLHTERSGRHYTALFSNTARAHQLGRTTDWVVIYLDDRPRRQWTAVTETAGPLHGHRVIRGREPECLQLLADDTEAGP